MLKANVDILVLACLNNLCYIVKTIHWAPLGRTANRLLRDENEQVATIANSVKVNGREARAMAGINTLVQN